MNKSKGFWLTIILISFLATLLSSCSEKITYSWRQKISVKIETPNGVVTGASVQDIRIIKAKKGMGGRVPKSGAYLTAEAVVVDLGEQRSERRFLFALLKVAQERVGADDISDILTRIVAPNKGARTHPALEVSDKQEIGSSFTVAEQLYPMLVTFDDITDPASVKRVDPNNLAASFGEGYALKSITLEITDEPVTSGKVESVLGWLYDVDRLIPKEKIEEFGRPIPSLLDLVDWQTFREKRK